MPVGGAEKVVHLCRDPEYKSRRLPDMGTVNRTPLQRPDIERLP